jgi:hypothetical protein
VSDVREARPAPQVRALVVVRHGPLADLLRAAEGANHTDWSPRTDKFQEGYKGRLGEISFVAQSVSKLVEIVRGQANEPVGGIATAFFSAAIPKTAPKVTVKGKGNAGSEPEETPDIEPTTPPSYVFTQNDDGFTIKHNPGSALSTRLTVRVAYDVLSGSAWSQYDDADFDFRKARGDVRVIASDAKVERKDPGNRLVVVPEGESYEIVATGFDLNRDLIVDVRDAGKADRKRKEAQVADQTDQLHQPQAVDA